MTVKLVAAKYTPSEGTTIEQGVKNGAVPRNAMYGGNGTYRVLGERNKYVLTVVDLNTGLTYQFDVRNQVKWDVLQGKRFTTRVAAWVLRALKNLDSFEIELDSYGNWAIQNLDVLMSRVSYI